ncbi:MAG: Gfo/Idh/MocA family oxidoreductase, partial [Candidatus Poribacteria bacterium]|nr:Gfo/Idh/MocA family oxidoreductase [Candidatus Poribacteria bacterium]
MRKTLRVGIIGTGYAGWRHAEAFSRLPDVAVTALWNRTYARAERLTSALSRPDIKIFSDWRDLVRSGDVDIISITTDPAFRQAPLTEGLAQNLHVLVEKPLALGLSEAKEMASLAQRARTVTAVSFNWRYSPGCQTCWRAIQEGQIGSLTDIRTVWRMRYSPSFGFARSWSEMSGSLREAGSHEFDRVRFLTGWDFKRVVCSLRSPQELRAILSDNSTPSDTSALVMSEMSGKSAGVLQLAITSGSPERQITIGGENGTLALSSEWVTHRLTEESNGWRILSNEVKVVRQRADESAPVKLEIEESDRQPESVQSGQHTWNR